VKQRTATAKAAAALSSDLKPPNSVPIGNNLDMMQATLEEGQEEGTAYHEAGHAVSGFALDWPPIRATIVPNGTVVGRTDFEDWPEPFTRVLPDSPAKRRFIEDRIVGVFAGGVAQTRKFPGRRLDDGDARDERQAKSYADYLYCDLETERVRQASLENGRIRAVPLVEKYWSSIEAVAQALTKHKTLDSEQLLALWVASSQECG
jgi:hypothetical protein